MIEEQVTSQMTNLGLKSAKIVAETSEDVIKALLLLLNQAIQRDKDNKLLKGDGEISFKKMFSLVEKGEQLKNLVIPDEDIEAFKVHMKNNGVLYAVNDLKKDDGKLVFYLKRDDKNMEDAVTIYQASKGLINEINPTLFLKNNTEKEVGVIKNLDEVELELFRYHANKNKLTFATIIKEGTIKVLFRESDISKVNETLKGISYDMSEEREPLVRKQVEYKISGRQQINLAINEAEKEYYIVSSKNPKNYVKLTDLDYTYYKNDKPISSLNREEVEFGNAVYEKIKGLVDPVCLTKEEFELSTRQKETIIANKTNLYPAGYNTYYDSNSNILSNVHTRGIEKRMEKYQMYYVPTILKDLDSVIAKAEIKAEKQEKKEKQREEIEKTR